MTNGKFERISAYEKYLSLSRSFCVVGVLIRVILDARELAHVLWQQENDQRGIIEAWKLVHVLFGSRRRENAGRQPRARTSRRRVGLGGVTARDMGPKSNRPAK